MAQQTLTPFGIEVKKKLIDLRLSQVELAEMLGIKKQYLNMILSGKRSGEKYIPCIVSILSLEAPDIKNVS